MFKSFWLKSVVVAMFSVIVGVSILYAQTTYRTKIESDAWKLFDWISKGLGAVAIAGGIAFAVIKQAVWIKVGFLNT